MGNFTAIIACLFGSYLLGSLPFAVLIGKVWKGIDVRNHGSGNAGATNVFRVLGKPIGFTVALADLGKGLAAGFAARFLLPELFEISSPAVHDTAQIAALYGVIIGHVFPVFAGFRGGKGVAAGAGALFALQPLVASVSLGVFILAVTAAGYVSLGSLTAAVIMPVTYIVSRSLDYYRFSTVWFIALWITAGLIAVMHRKNISRLIHGKENRFRTLWYLLKKGS
ncbi:MAG: glycerol-3-phosphate 1-O-acyltransferase PlsY [Spirochaetia bacterium]